MEKISNIAFATTTTELCRFMAYTKFYFRDGDLEPLQLCYYTKLNFILVSKYCNLLTKVNFERGLNPQTFFKYATDGIDIVFDLYLAN